MTKRKPRTHFTVELQPSENDDWIVSALTHTSAAKAALAASVALRNYAESGFFPAVRLRQWEAERPKAAPKSESILPAGFTDPREH